MARPRETVGVVGAGMASVVTATGLEPATWAMAVVMRATSVSGAAMDCRA